MRLHHYQNNFWKQVFLFHNSVGDWEWEWQWYGHVSHSSGLAKTILQGTVERGQRQTRQKKRWEDNIREWTGLEFAKSQRAVENRKMDETGCEVTSGAPTTPALKGQVR